MIKKIKNTLNSLSPGVKASTAFFIASVVVKGISYITTPFFTRLLTDTEYGRVSVFYTWMQVLGVIAMFNLSSGVFNNGMVDYPEKRDEYSFSMLVLSSIITVSFGVVFFAFLPLTKSVIGVSIPLLILMFVIFLFQPAYSFWTSKQRYELKYKATVIVSIAIGIISPLISILAIAFSKNDRIYARLFGAEIPLILIYFVFVFIIAKKSKFRLETKYWKGALLFNLPLIPHYLSVYLLSSSDRIMIDNMVGSAQAGYYSIAYSVASVATIIWSAVNASLVPYTYERCKKNDYKSISNVTIKMLYVFAAACFAVILLAPEVVRVLATEDYYEAIYAIPPIVGGVFFQVQYFVYSNILYYHKKPKYVMYSSVTATVVNLALNYVCIKKFGYLAAGYTTLFCYMLQAFIDCIAMKKVVGHFVYDMKKIITLSGIVVVTALTSNLLYAYVAVRYSILGLILLCAILFRKKLMAIISPKRTATSDETEEATV